ncbi:hypothetical protein SAMN04488693_1401, partial [Arthrobacter subterraneus]
DTAITQLAPLSDLRGIQPMLTQERTALLTGAGILVLR